MDIPQKYYYTIGDICKLTGTKAHILRYWESQFKLLRPARRYSGHRKYSEKDLDLIHKIRHLIIDRKFTLAGAKKEILRQLSGKTKSGVVKNIHNAKPESNTVLSELKLEIEECIHLLTSDEKQQELIQI